MRIPVIFIVVLIGLVCAVCTADPQSGDVLQSLQVVFRHGDRSPIKELPYEPAVWNCTRWPTQGPNPQAMYSIRPLDGHPDILPGTCFSGQLTDIGFQQVQQLGMTVMKRYSDTLLNRLTQNDVEVRTTEVQRTIDSAIGFLNGLGLPFNVPVLYHVEKSKEDMSVNPEVCPRMALFVLDHYRSYVPLVELLLPHTLQWKAIFHSDDPFIGLIYFNTLQCRQFHGMALPSGLTTDLFAVLQKADTLLKGTVINETYASVTPFLRVIMDRLQSSASSAPSLSGKLFVYSAHDTTVAPLLRSLSLYRQWPHYAESVAIELWHNNISGSSYVTVRNDDVVVIDRVPLGPFLQTWSKVLPGDFQSFCKV